MGDRTNKPVMIRDYLGKNSRLAGSGVGTENDVFIPQGPLKFGLSDDFGLVWP